MDLEMRLRATLTAVLKQLKELRALRRQQALEEREAEEDDRELGAWEPGEWDYDPARFGGSFDDDGDAPVVRSRRANPLTRKTGKTATTIATTKT
jgi:hypothetical protein